jgi:hypothetical protein
MATISNTPRPGYVWDSTDNVWYPIGVGGHGHPDYITQATAVNPTIIDAKGDIITATAADTPARLAVGTNGQVLTADSTAATGLAWTTASSAATSLGYAAGKNAIINGAFNVWQRGTSFTNPAASAYTADRFSIDYNTGTVNCVVSQQAFTPGTAPVAGYESQYFLRVAQSAATASKFIYVGQKIEDVRTFAGQTVTFSFWAKANATKTLKSRSVQIFGSGGSSGVATSETSNTVTTSWTRFSNTITVGSVSGKTIGAGSYILFDLNWDSNAIQDIDIWGFQVESGSVATAFQTATGTLQGELAACQRYYYRSGSSSSSRPIGFHLYGQGSTSGQAVGMAKVTMRVAPTSLEFSNLKSDDPGDASYAITGFTMGNPTDNCFQCDWTVASGSANGGNYILQTNTGGGYLAFSAEL